MEIMTEDKLRYLAGKHGYNVMYLEKDYFLTLLLYMIKDIPGIYFRGGTCLNKIFLNHIRLSEDLDFVSNRPITEIRNAIEKSIDKKIFGHMEKDRSSTAFVRYHLYFKSYFHNKSYIMLDINRKGSVLLSPEVHRVKNFYGLHFDIPTLNMEEIVAEKIRALITRNQPRDYFDAYFILKKYRLNMDLLRRKVNEANEVFDMERIFKYASRVYSKWETDLLPLTNRKIRFLTVIKFLEKKLRKINTEGLKW